MKKSSVGGQFAEKCQLFNSPDIPCLW